MCVGLVVAIAVGLKGARGSESGQTASPGVGTSTSAPTSTTTTRPTTTSPSTTHPATSPSTTHRYRSTGRYRSLAVGGPVRGRAGTLRTYRVEVEEGAGVPVREFAAAVDRTLRHPRGWMAGGHWRFQRVTSADADLTIRLATPDTVDRQCAAAGAHTDGYTSCRAGRYVLLNLDRWLEGVPHITDLALYRAYLVNHEVGHGLGRGHESCPGRGRPAPVMLQQTLGLQGCTANPWPRTAGGAMVSGPPAG